MFANAPTDNAPLTVARMLRMLGIRISEDTVRETLKRHSDFPALSSLCDALTIWGVQHAPLRLTTIDQLQELPLPFIVHLHQQGGWFRLITNLSDNRITYWDSATGRGKQSMTQFERVWDGIVLIAEPRVELAEKEDGISWRIDRINKLRQPTLWLAALLIVGLIATFRLPMLNAMQWGWGLTKSLGLTLSIALLTKQFGVQNNFVNRLCQIGSKASCQSLLNSPGAKLWGWLSWAEVGTLYFAVTLGVWLLDPTNPLMMLLALLAMPYIVYSIYYQGRVARIWCPLCLCVQGILFAEGTLTFLSGSVLQQLVSVTSNNWLMFVTIGVVVLIGWLLIKPLIDAALKLPNENEALLKFKRNIHVFNTLLINAEPMAELPITLRPLWLGRDDAQHIITFVTNPYCNYCAEKHKQVLRLIAKQSNIAVRLIFFLTSEEDKRVMQVAGHLLSLGPEQATTAINDWFDQTNRDYVTWASRHSLMNGSLPEYDMATQHAHWCKKAGVQFTPTIFLNGKRFPEQYEMDDLYWLLKG